MPKCRGCYMVYVVLVALFLAVLKRTPPPGPMLALLPSIVSLGRPRFALLLGWWGEAAWPFLHSEDNTYGLKPGMYVGIPGEGVELALTSARRSPAAALSFLSSCLLAMPNLSRFTACRGGGASCEHIVVLNGTVVIALVPASRCLVPIRSAAGGQRAAGSWSWELERGWV